MTEGIANNQIQELMNFIHKHFVSEISLNKKESDDVENIPVHCDTQMSIFIPSKTITDRVR